MPTVDRATFVNLEVSWRRQVGDVRVTPHPATPGRREYDYMTLSRTCGRAAAEEVGAQMLALALQSNAYYTAHVEPGYVAFSIAISCEDRDGVVVDTIPAEITEPMPALEMAQ